MPAGRREEDSWVCKDTQPPTPSASQAIKKKKKKHPKILKREKRSLLSRTARSFCWWPRGTERQRDQWDARLPSTGTHGWLRQGCTGTRPHVLAPSTPLTHPILAPEVATRMETRKPGSFSFPVGPVLFWGWQNPAGTGTQCMGDVHLHQDRASPGQIQHPPSGPRVPMLVLETLLGWLQNVVVMRVDTVGNPNLRLHRCATASSTPLTPEP